LSSTRTSDLPATSAAETGVRASVVMSSVVLAGREDFASALPPPVGAVGSRPCAASRPRRAATAASTTERAGLLIVLTHRTTSPADRSASAFLLAISGRYSYQSLRGSRGLVVTCVSTYPITQRTAHGGQQSISLQTQARLTIIFLPTKARATSRPDQGPTKQKL
jgi:hypothetical protein